MPPPVFIQDNLPHISKGGKALPNVISDVSESQTSPQLSGTAPNTKESKELNSFGSTDEFQTTETHEDSHIQHSLTTPSLVANESRVEEEAVETAIIESNSKENAESEADFINTRTFNGMTMNAVFPVPSSSLVITVWSGILKAANPNLESNPFGRSNYLFSELLDLTLPPVDSIPISSIYKVPNVSQNTSKDVANFQVDGVQAVSNESAKGVQIGVLQPSQLYAKVEQPQKVATNNSTNHNSSITALKQLFPGVNLNYGGAPGNVMATGMGNRL